MKRYLIRQEADGLHLFGESGAEVPASSVLEVYPESRVYAFEGSLGAGKTTFVKQLCKEMGVEDVVNSPTFAIVNVYAGKGGEDLYHFDCYRLNSADEARDFGAEDYLYSGSYCFVEWPDVISSLLPEDTVWIDIEVQADGSRMLTVR